MKFLEVELNRNGRITKNVLSAKLSYRQLGFSDLAAKLINANDSDRFDIVEDNGNFYLVKLKEGRLVPVIGDGRKTCRLVFNNTAFMTAFLKAMGLKKEDRIKFDFSKTDIWRKDYKDVFLFSIIKS